MIAAAAAAGVAMEINAQVDASTWTRPTRAAPATRGSRIVISSDAHSAAGLGALRWGVTVARRAWLAPRMC